MKIVFMGTPDFSVSALENLIKHHEVIAVYTQPPRPAGKGLTLVKSPVHECAEKNNIPVYTPASFKKEPSAVEQLKQLNAEVGIVCAYGLILPESVLTAFPKGCINIHASLLPRWRGAAPIQRCIQAGDEYSGVTIMQMDEGLDTGDMLLQEKVLITPETTGEILHDQLSELGAKLIVKALAENPKPRPQPQEGDTYAHKVLKQEMLIDWTQEAEQLERSIRAFNPYPAMYFMYQNERIKVFKAGVEQAFGMAGEVLDNNGLIACEKGAIRLLEVQKEGKKRMSFADFLKGSDLSKGTHLAK